MVSRRHPVGAFDSFGFTGESRARTPLNGLFNGAIGVNQSNHPAAAELSRALRWTGLLQKGPCK